MTIDFDFTPEDNHVISIEHSDRLNESALRHISGMTMEGYASGELYEEIYDVGQDDPTVYRGRWTMYLRPLAPFSFNDNFEADSRGVGI